MVGALVLEILWVKVSPGIRSFTVGHTSDLHIIFSGLMLTSTVGAVVALNFTMSRLILISLGIGSVTYSESSINDTGWLPRFVQLALEHLIARDRWANVREVVLEILDAHSSVFDSLVNRLYQNGQVILEGSY